MLGDVCDGQNQTGLQYDVVSFSKVRCIVALPFFVKNFERHFVMKNSILNSFCC